MGGESHGAGSEDGSRVPPPSACPPILPAPRFKHGCFRGPRAVLGPVLGAGNRMWVCESYVSVRARVWTCEFTCEEEQV